jgi:quercetin dioxygenase-like cupin family protein
MTENADDEVRTIAIMKLQNIWKQKELRMRPCVGIALVLISLAVGSSSVAQDAGVTKPIKLLKKVVAGMPKSDLQEIRVLTASFKPGDKTVFHTHRFPVTVYILEGAFTLEMEGRQPITVKAGQAMVEPPNVRMTGYNRSATDPIRLVIFYVSDPDTPFLDPIQ